MGNVTVVGSQWGDEGKGKIVDWLSSRADVVVRFQGGHNAGHTLVVDGVQYKLSLLPSGVVRGGKLSVIGNGVVVDPWALLDEIDTMAAKGVGVSPETLTIAENVCLILPIHRELDQAREEARGGAKLGTTGRGIGPAYEDKVGRRAIRLCDLRDVKTLRPRLGELLLHHNALRRGFGMPDADAAELEHALLATRAPPAALRGAGLAPARPRPAGGQAHPLRGRAGGDARHRPRHLSLRHLVQHARRPGGGGRRSRAGDHRLRARHHQGVHDPGRRRAVPHRARRRGRPHPRRARARVRHRDRPPRRCGWFDSVLVRQAVKIGGIKGIALTKLDVLDGMPALKVCVGYRRNGEVLDHIPAATADQAQVRPVYESFDGWQESTRGARSWADLPATAVKYIRRIEELIEAPVAMLSTSPEREDTILVRDPFAD